MRTRELSLSVSQLFDEAKLSQFGSNITQTQRQGTALSQRRLAFSDMCDWLVPMGISLLALAILALFALALFGVPPD